MASRFCLLLWALCISLPAHAADWLRAESDHYIVHAQLEEAELRALMLTIEDFDRVVHGIVPGDTTPGRKPEFYLADDDRRIARIINFGATGVCENHPELPIAYVRYDPSRLAKARNSEIFFCVSQFHLNNAFFRPKPMWLTAGVPQFFATAYRNDEGLFIVGAPNALRPYRGKVSETALADALKVQVRHRSETAYAHFFDLSRVLAGPLLLDRQYAGVLNRYLDAYSAGRTMEDAARELGDLNALAQQLNQRRVVAPMRRVMIDPPVNAEIAIRPMQADEIAVYELRMERLFRNRHENIARKLAALTRRRPESALVWYEYAAAEYARVKDSDFGGDPVFRGFGFSSGEIIVTANPYSDSQAWRAVNRAIDLNPELAQAQRLRAEILLSRLVRAGELTDAEEFNEVRQMLAPLARDPERHPLAAALYHQSYVEQGREPPEVALDQLARAFMANAGVGDIRYAYATALSRRGEKALAHSLLISMLNDPAFEVAAWRALEMTD